MVSLLKILIPLSLALLMIIGFYWLYRSLNDKIMDGQTMTQVVAYAVLLFLSCAALFFGGLLVIFSVYIYLFE